MLTASDDDWMAVVGKFGEGAEELGAVVSGSEPGGSRPKGVEDLLYRSCPGGLTLWGGDLGPHSEDGEGPGQLSVQGYKEYH